MLIIHESNYKMEKRHGPHTRPFLQNNSDNRKPPATISQDSASGFSALYSEKELVVSAPDISAFVS